MTTQDSFKRNSKYYLDGDFVTVTVKGELFRVPRYRFTKNSELFRDLFQLPQGDRSSTEVEGESDRKPIPLPVPDDITVDGFVSFLEVLYPLNIPPVEVQGLDAWKAVMKLATTWLFENIRTIASSKLDVLMQGDEHATQNIVLGRQYEKGDWLVRGYKALVQRKESITNEEIKVLGWKTAADIFRLREGLRPQTVPAVPTRNPCPCGQSASYHSPSSTSGVYCTYYGQWYSGYTPSIVPSATTFNETEVSSRVDDVLREELGAMQRVPTT